MNDLRLDRFDVPPLSAGFADRVVAAAATRLPPLPEARPPRDRRGGWRRGATVLGGSLALGLLSATAAATGYFGAPVQQAVREAPVIGPIIAQVAPAKPEPVRVAKPVQKPAPVAIEQAAAPVDPVTARRDEIAQRIVQRIEERRRQRAELGLPQRPVRPRDVGRALRQLPPEERRAVVQRLREIHDERRAAAWSAMSEEEKTAALNRAESRRVLREQRQLRRQQWLERRRALENAPPEGSAPPARYEDQAAPSGSPDPDPGGAAAP